MNQNPIISLLSSIHGFLMDEALKHMSLVKTRYRINFDRVGPKKRKTGKDYPHSSKRQQARYARKIASGQLSF
jgi:hypothetical protein